MVSIDDLNLIPCQDQSKKPAISWKEYQTKKYDKEITCTNRAVILGTSSCGAAVIDIDAPGLEHRIFDDFDAVLGQTLVTKTGSGGIHVYVIPKTPYPVKRLDDDQGNHIDIQTQGTYVIAPGSIHPNGNTYEIISRVKTIIEDFNMEKFVERLATFGFNTEGSGLPSNEEIAKGLTSGNRNSGAFKYACHLTSVVGLEYDQLKQAMKDWNFRCSPPLQWEELKSVIDHAYDRVVKDKLPLKQIIDEEDQEQAQKRTMIEISAKDEAELINFDCLCIGWAEHKTVIYEVQCHCANCDIDDVVHGTGYDNPNMPKCGTCHRKMEELPRTRRTVDTREILIEQLPEEVKPDGSPIQFTAKLKGPLIHTMKINKRYNVTARFTSVVNARVKSGNDIILQVFKCKPLEEPDDTPLTPKEREYIDNLIKNNGLKPIIDSIAPRLEGLHTVKELVLTTMAGIGTVGDSRQISHLFLVGNPSRGKSVILKWIAETAQKGQYVNAKSSSGVGLTYSMVKLSNGTMIPQPGAMVKNDLGIVCLDETDKASSSDRYNLLECLEQMSVTLNKSGAQSGIPVNARTCLIAAANPVDGLWDNEAGLFGNLNIEVPFLSRFDRVYNLGKMTQIERQRIAQRAIDLADSNTPEAAISQTMFRHYLNTIKHIQPTLSKEAKEKIYKWFNNTADAIDKSLDKLPMEARQIEGMIRNCKSRAKCYMQTEVTPQMVDEEIELFNACLASINFEIKDNTLQSTFGEVKLSKQKAFIKAIKQLRDEETGLFHRDELEDHLVNAYSETFPTIHDVRTFWENTGVNIVKKDHTTLQWLLR